MWCRGRQATTYLEVIIPQRSHLRFILLKVLEYRDQNWKFMNWGKSEVTSSTTTLMTISFIDKMLQPVLLTWQLLQPAQNLLDRNWNYSEAECWSSLGKDRDQFLSKTLKKALWPVLICVLSNLVTVRKQQFVLWLVWLNVITVHGKYHWYQQAERKLVQVHLDMMTVSWNWTYNFWTENYSSIWSSVRPHVLSSFSIPHFSG